MSAPAALKARAISTASSGVMPPSTQSCAEMRTDIGRSLGPDRAHGAEHFQRIAQAVLQRAAVFVGALVGQRRDEAGQQVAVRAVQLQPVEAGLAPPARCCARSPRAPGPCRRASSRATSRSRRRGTAAARPRSAASCLARAAGPRLPTARGSSPWRRRARAAWRSSHRCCCVHEVDDALPAIALRLAPQAGAAGRDAGIGRRAGHLGHHHAGAAHGARAQVHQVVVGRHARRRTSTAPWARPPRGSSA